LSSRKEKREWKSNYNQFVRDADQREPLEVTLVCTCELKNQVDPLSTDTRQRKTHNKGCVLARIRDLLGIDMETGFKVGSNGNLVHPNSVETLQKKAFIKKGMKLREGHKNEYSYDELKKAFQNKLMSYNEQGEKYSEVLTRHFIELVENVAEKAKIEAESGKNSAYFTVLLGKLLMDFSKISGETQRSQPTDNKEVNEMLQNLSDRQIGEIIKKDLSRYLESAEIVK
jgi:hypothetical protein